ncbi:MAG: glycosyl hydrolase family 17 [Candidatus Marinimicrobia bacterium]|nr:glycosyl hydrolase family 17 [Candidatus Neomarinimicrobiota bacterium]|tara:strand:- start:373 stop:1293 length:921 start_codon:yes stop_codon:yes gene_type:complete
MIKKTLQIIFFFSCCYALIPFHSNAICYGPFRDGQSPEGESPTVEQLKEDIRIISKHWSIMRMYGSRGVTEDVIKIIKENNINLKIFLGAWLSDETDSSIAIQNNEEVEKAIYLANKYPNIINAVIIGNETQVFWTWNKVNFEILKNYIIKVKNNVKQSVTTADDFNFWNKPEGIELSNYTDFILVHIHPLWGGLSVENSVDWVSKIYNEIEELHPDKQIIIGETGWATMVHDIGEQAKLIKGITGEKEQAFFYKNIHSWSKKHKITTFFFEVFDEKWKGGDHPNEVEKHWGVFNSDRTPKLILKK